MGRTAIASDERVAALRRFNRFYTQRIGVLREDHLGSGFSLGEVRVLYELAHRRDPTAVELARDLNLDAGYLSRVLSSFERAGLLQRTTSGADRRRSLLSLTRRGRSALAHLERETARQVAALLGRLAPAEADRLLAAMGTIEELLGAPRGERAVLLRPHQAGDLGWVVERHGRIYGDEYGWDERFEALVAGVVAGFGKHHDPARERCWIAEVDGERAGAVFLVRRSKAVAQLRLLLVEPRVRGLGIGGRLVSECIRFARQAGYAKITLWTNSVLHAARRIYQRTGFELVHEAPHADFGTRLIGQTWGLKL